MDRESLDLRLSLVTISPNHPCHHVHCNQVHLDCCRRPWILHGIYVLGKQCSFRILCKRGEFHSHIPRTLGRQHNLHTRGPLERIDYQLVRADAVDSFVLWRRCVQSIRIQAAHDPFIYIYLPCLGSFLFSYTISFSFVDRQLPPL